MAVEIGKRCIQHNENNCTAPKCVLDAVDAATNPRRHRPKATPGAPEVSWALPHRKLAELKLMGKI